MCQDGIWRYNIIDDFIPCKKQKKMNKPVFIQVYKK